MRARYALAVLRARTCAKFVLRARTRGEFCLFGLCASCAPNGWCASNGSPDLRMQPYRPVGLYATCALAHVDVRFPGQNHTYARKIVTKSGMFPHPSCDTYPSCDTHPMRQMRLTCDTNLRRCRDRRLDCDTCQRCDKTRHPSYGMRPHPRLHFGATNGRGHTRSAYHPNSSSSPNSPRACSQLGHWRTMSSNRHRARTKRSCHAKNSHRVRGSCAHTSHTVRHQNRHRRSNRSRTHLCRIDRSSKPPSEEHAPSVFPASCT